MECNLRKIPRTHRENPFAAMLFSLYLCTRNKTRTHKKHKIMKRYIITLLLAMTAWMSANAMSYERAREEALYLTDKMAYELNLNDQQYNDAYEINLDYFLCLNSERDLYEDYLTYRLTDLNYILHDWQYRLLMASDYFVRPVIWRSGAWFFPIYGYYNHGHYYYSRPSVYFSYHGGHGHRHYSGVGFYVNRRPTWNGGLRGSHAGGIDRHDHGYAHGRGNSHGNYGREGGMNRHGHEGDRRGNNSNYDRQHSGATNHGMHSSEGTHDRRTSDRGMDRDSHSSGNSFSTSSSRTTVGDYGSGRSEGRGSSREGNLGGSTHNGSRGGNFGGSTRSGMSSGSRGGNFGGGTRSGMSSGSRGGNNGAHAGRR